MIAKHMLSVSVLLAAGLALDLPAGEVWDKVALGRTPRVFEVALPCSNDCGRVEGVRPVFVEGEPLAGRETRVFAWVGLPKGASAGRKVSGMVLVHGGGGTAFASWVKTWNDRGYAAIAMDTCGGIPQGERDGRPHPRHPWSGPAGWCESLRQIGEPMRDQWTYHAVAAAERPDAEGRFAARVPPGAVMFFANAITDDGLVASSRVLTRQPKAACEASR